MRALTSCRLLCAILIGASLWPTLCAQDFPKLAPYSAIRWEGETPEVQIDGGWSVLRSIDGVSVEKILAFAKGKYARRWQNRFEEDLVQVLSEMGHPPGEKVRLGLFDAKTGTERTLEGVPMTKKNRAAILDANRAKEGRPALDTPMLDLMRSLDEFRDALDHRWSYRHVRQADFEGAIAALRKRVEAGIAVNDFGIELQKIIALGIDGHAGVDGYERPGKHFLPFLSVPNGRRVVAYRKIARTFVVDGFPYLTKIDGRDVDEWCAAAAVLVPKGSPHFQRNRSLRELRHLDFLRAILGLESKDSVAVELEDETGNHRTVVTLNTASEPLSYGQWPRHSSKIIDDNVGYLRLPTMDGDSSVAIIKRWMPRFKDTVGLVVDVRDNGGGERDALLRLHSYLVGSDHRPRVVNVAAYRLHDAHDADHLEKRFLYRANSDHWTEAERQAIAEFAETFKPEWEPTEGHFSDWHYLVIRPLSDPEIFHYTKPVVVLMNENCFSATDIFLAGLKGLKNVTLIGTPSGGGSARIKVVLLTGSPFTVKIGSMISFQSDGKLFDGNGVQPDIVVQPKPEYYIGGADDALAKAVELIKAR